MIVSNNPGIMQLEHKIFNHAPYSSMPSRILCKGKVVKELLEKR